MRKKNHQKRNASGGKATRKQDVAKVKKVIKKEEINIILQIQNLINEDVIKNNNSNATVIETKSVSSLNCGSDESDIDESISKSIIDFGLSKFVSTSSDSEESSDEDHTMKIDSNYSNLESENESIDKEVIQPSEVQKLSKLTRIEDNLNINVMDSNQKDTQSIVVDMMNRPLLSLCNSAKSNAKNQSVEAISSRKKECTYQCSLCPSKFMKIWNFEKHMRYKHPDLDHTTNNENENIMPEETDINQPSYYNHSHESVKTTMSNIIRGRIMKLLKTENEILGHNSNSFLESYNLLAERLADKIVTVSDERFNREFLKISSKNEEVLSDFEL